MTQSELEEIEQRLGLSLPAEYRTTMLSYPFTAGSFADECMLPNRPTAVLDLNEARVPLPASVARPFFVGSDGGEESYFVDAARLDSPVFVFELETGRHRIQAASWVAYLQGIRDTLVEIAVDEQAERERRLTKRWWEFWK